MCLSALHKIIPLVVVLPFLMWGCTTTPENLRPVTGFDASRYMGLWYEIARLDHSFERGLTDVTATYSPRDDGGIDVINRGYDPVKDKWKQARGKAYFVKEKNVGRLKVSFFGPFYGGYNVIDLDHENYSFALVCGPKRSYLWILSRTPDMAESLKTRLVQTAKDLGFETDGLIFVKHTRF